MRSKPRLIASGLVDCGRFVSWLMTTSGSAACTARTHGVGVEGVADRRDDAGQTKGGDPILAAGEHGDVVTGRDQRRDERTPDGPGPAGDEDAHGPEARHATAGTGLSREPVQRLWQDGGVSEHDGYPGAPPGWYPDPAGGPGQRWWDGYAWTDPTVLPQHPPPPPWAGAVPPQGPPSPGGAVGRGVPAAARLQRAGLVDAELRWRPWRVSPWRCRPSCSIVNLVIVADQRRTRISPSGTSSGSTTTTPSTTSRHRRTTDRAPSRPLVSSSASCRWSRSSSPWSGSTGRRRRGVPSGLPADQSPGLGRGLVVRAHRQLLVPLSWRCVTASHPATRIGRGCCSGGSRGS